MSPPERLGVLLDRETADRYDRKVLRRVQCVAPRSLDLSEAKAA